MRYVVNIPELLRQITGVQGVSLQQLVDKRPIEYENDIELIEEPEYVELSSVLGTPIIESLRVKNPDTDEWLEFEDAPAIVSVNLEKNIVRNQISGKTGTVKEYTNTGDYVITIRGLIVKPKSMDRDFERIDKLHQLERINDALEVESRLLNTLGINNIVIQSIEHPGSEDYTNVYPFIWNCLSDFDYDLNQDQQRQVNSFSTRSNDPSNPFALT